MTALGANVYFVQGRTQSPEYRAVCHKIEELWGRYLRVCDDEIVDEINRLRKEKEYLERQDHQAVESFGLLMEYSK